jgi:hypothetical protein
VCAGCPGSSSTTQWARRWRPIPHNEGELPGRRWGVTPNSRGELTTRLRVHLPADLGELIRRATWWTSAPATTRLQELAEIRTLSEDQLAERDRLRAQVVTTGDLIRAAAGRAARRQPPSRGYPDRAASTPTPEQRTPAKAAEPNEIWAD